MNKRNLIPLLILACCPFVYSQANVAILPHPFCYPCLDANGHPLSGGKVFSYSAGTTSALATYADSTGTVQNTNPIVLSAAGFPTNSSGSIVGIWLGTARYKIIVQNSLGVQQFLLDGLSGNNLFNLATVSISESTAPAGNIGTDVLFADSAGHRFKMSNNNGTPDFIVGQNTTDTLSNKTLASALLASPTISSETVSGTNAHTGTDSFASVNNIKFADQFPSVQAAMAALPLGGGTVILQCGIAYTGPPATSFTNGISLESLCPNMYSTSLNYSSSLTIGPVSGIRIVGINFNFSTGTGGLTFDGIQQSFFDMTVICSTGSPCTTLTATTQNAVHNRWDYLNITTGGAKGLEVAGTGAINAGFAFTDSDIRNLVVNMSRATLGAITQAIGFGENCDSNHFWTTHLFFSNVNAGNGVVFNDTGTPAADTDADMLLLNMVDFTSGVTITGNAFTVNKSQGVKWAEGFGVTSFTTAIAADSTTHYTREPLSGNSLALGFTNLQSPPGVTTVTTNLPSIGGTLATGIGTGTSTSNGTVINAGTSQAQPAITVTGATTSNVAYCSLNATPVATWQTGIVLLPPVVTANTVTPWLSNPTAGNITPVAAVIRCTVVQ